MLVVVPLFQVITSVVLEVLANIDIVCVTHVNTLVAGVLAILIIGIPPKTEYVLVQPLAGLVTVKVNMPEAKDVPGLPGNGPDGGVQVKYALEVGLLANNEIVLPLQPKV